MKPYTSILGVLCSLGYHIYLGNVRTGLKSLQNSEKKSAAADDDANDDSDE